MLSSSQTDAERDRGQTMTTAFYLCSSALNWDVWLKGERVATMWSPPNVCFLSNDAYSSALLFEQFVQGVAGVPSY